MRFVLRITFKSSVFPAEIYLPNMFFFKKAFFLIALFVSFASYVTSDNPSLNLSSKEQKERSVKLPPCKLCTVLADSLKKAMKITNRGKHEGGDAAWEEKNLRPYSKSELRLVEVEDLLCSDVVRGRDQCHDFANENEPHIREWVQSEQEIYPDFLDWFCIDKLKVCCPIGHFGPNCEECNDCSGNGKCKGNGTRKGNGKCSCDSGYSGEHCNDCSINFYEAFRDETKLLCSKCHTSCNNEGCAGAGPKACRGCLVGWQMDRANGCTDINECLTTPKICMHNQFCVNNEGSYSCLECDRSCSGCDGDGPDMCKECAEGYFLRDGKCTDDTTEQREQYANIARFLTYFGLCVATCVIFQSSTYVAYIVGAAVAIYISASEYWLHTTPAGAGKPFINTKELEEIIMKSL